MHSEFVFKRVSGWLTCLMIVLACSFPQVLFELDKLVVRDTVTPPACQHNISVREHILGTQYENTF